MSPEGNWSKCCQCDSMMWLPMTLWDAAYKAKEKITFYCAYGHPQHFVSGESKENKLRRERDRLAQQIAERDDRISELIRKGTAAQAEVHRLTTRASHGVCPCCKRTFSQLARHMKAKHPDFKALRAV